MKNAASHWFPLGYSALVTYEYLYNREYARTNYQHPTYTQKFCHHAPSILLSRGSMYILLAFHRPWTNSIQLAQPDSQRSLPARSGLMSPSLPDGSMAELLWEAKLEIQIPSESFKGLEKGYRGRNKDNWAGLAMKGKLRFSIWAWDTCIWGLQNSMDMIQGSHWFCREPHFETWWKRFILVGDIGFI